jgi:squalene-hopene/tetraprenyl-beta-curcumene cyclase
MSPWRRFGAALALLAAPAVAAGDPPPKPAANRPDEPVAAALSLEKAAGFLDAVTLAWLRDNKCASCHTGYPYLLARASFADPKSAAAAQVRRFFEDRVTAWDEGGKGAGYLKGNGAVRNTEGITEVIAVAATLAVDDARTAGKLHPLTRRALDRMWELQRADGAWAWNRTRLAPLEHDEYFGAVFAAAGVGHAPGDYAKSESAKEGVDRLRGYLRKNPPPDLHHTAWLVWASVKLDGLLTPAERDKAVESLRAAQRADGGWCLPALGAWKRRDGKPNDPAAPSDGYATGLVVYVLRQTGVPADDPAVRKGIDWLKANQRASGRWFTRSLNADRGHLIAHAGTAFAVLALKSCDGTDK